MGFFTAAEGYCTSMESKKTPREWRPALLGLVLYTLFALLYLRPIWRVGADHIAPSAADPVFNLWVLEWGAHQVRQGLPDFWNANVYHPNPGTLTLSDHLLGPAAQLAAFEAVVPNAIAGYNFLFFTSFVASAFTTAWVLRRSGRTWAVALLAGWMFAFSPFRLFHLNHIQMLIAQWIPLTLWFWDRLLAERTPKAAALFLLPYLLHVTSGCYLAYMIHFPMLAILLVRLREHRRDLFAPRSLRVLAPVALVAVATLAALFLPYVQVSHHLDLSRPREEVAEYAATAASWLTPAPRNLYWISERNERAVRKKIGPALDPFLRSENALFPGFLPTGLFLLGIWTWWRGRRRTDGVPLSRGRRVLLGVLLALALAAWIWGDLLTLAHPTQRAAMFGGLGRFGWEAPALLLVLALGAWFLLRRSWRGTAREAASSWGPWEKGIALGGIFCFALAHPIVYIPLMRILPGLDGMRVPARFAAFVSFTIVVFAALAADRLLVRRPTRAARIAVTAALALVLLVEMYPRGVRWLPLQHKSEFAPVYHWLAGRDDIEGLLEMPVRQNWRETAYMHMSTLHWQPIANGYSGYRPTSHREIASRMRWVPDRSGLELLRGYRVSHLVLHLDQMKEKKARQALARFESELAGGPEREVELVWSAPRTRVYRILPRASTPNRAGLWKSAGRTRVGDQAENSGASPSGRSIR
jgi:hypothetical protein